MKIIKFTGTPDEFKTVSYLFEDPFQGSVPEQQSDEVFSVSTKEAIRAVLRRRPIPESQRMVYKALSDGEISYDELLNRTKKSRQEQAGIMGALGARINGTKEIRLAGLPGNITALINYREFDDITYVSLTDDATAALKEEGII